MVKWAKQRVAILLVSVGLVAFGGASVVAFDKLSTAAEEAVERATLEESCERFGNTLRVGLREFFTSELERAENPDPKALEQFGLTVAEAKALSAERIEELKYNINVRFKDVPCKRVYKNGD